jgi:VanZ family protein
VTARTARIEPRTTTPSTAKVRTLGFARYLLLVLLALSTYASLRPFSGWRVPPQGWLAMFDTPPVLDRWDVILNVLGYVPLGFFALLAFASSRRPVWVALVLAVIFCSGYSVAMEVLQTALPSRSSNLADVFHNALGAAAGALAASVLAGWMLSAGGLSGLRERHIARGWQGDIGLALILFWAVALLAPRTLLFGNGDARLLFGVQAQAGLEQPVFHAIEAVVCALGLIGFALLLKLTFTTGRWTLRVLLIAALAASLATRSTGFGLFWTSANAFNWLTPGAMIGLAIGTLFALALIELPQRAAAIGAAIVLSLSMLIVNLSPPNPYLWTKPRPTRALELAPVSMATRTAAMLWPAAAIGFALMVAARARAGGGARRSVR